MVLQTGQLNCSFESIKLLRLLKTKRRQFSDCPGREHPRRHFIHDAMHAVRLDYDVNRGIAARFHQQIAKVDPHVMQAVCGRKIMRSPRPLCRLAVDNDCRRAEIEKERQGKETRLDLNAGPGLLHRFSLSAVRARKTPHQTLPAPGV